MGDQPETKSNKQRNDRTSRVGISRPSKLNLSDLEKANKDMQAGLETTTKSLPQLESYVR